MKLTVVVPSACAVKFAMVVPGASGCSSGGALKETLPTLTPEPALAVQPSSASDGNCTMIRCPTTAVTVLGNEATNNGGDAFTFVLVGLAVGRGVGRNVGELLVALGEGSEVRVALGVVDCAELSTALGTVEGSELTESDEHPAAPRLKAPAIAMSAEDRRRIECRDVSRLAEVERGRRRIMGASVPHQCDVSSQHPRRVSD